MTYRGRGWGSHPHFINLVLFLGVHQPDHITPAEASIYYSESHYDTLPRTHISLSIAACY